MDRRNDVHPFQAEGEARFNKALGMKRENWKQATPQDQLVAIRGSLEGHLSNFKDGIIDRAKFIERANDHLNQIAELHPFLTGAKAWKPESNGPLIFFIIMVVLFILCHFI